MVDEIYIQYFCKECRKFFNISASAPANLIYCEFCSSYSVTTEIDKAETYKTKKPKK